jgi:orotate phosphoribosyltransferase-like protein
MRSWQALGEVAVSLMRVSTGLEDAAVMTGLEEAAVSLMRASTGLEVAAVMAGLVGAAAAMADSQRCCDCGGGGSVKMSR